VIVSDQLATVLVTSAVPTFAVLVGILVNDFRWNAIIRKFDADFAAANRRFHNLKLARQGCLRRMQS
jgi:hypothetical protein